MFLTSSVDNNSIDCLERTVPVCMPSAAHQFGSHPDVYTCEYEYDSVWKVRLWKSDSSMCLFTCSCLKNERPLSSDSRLSVVLNQTCLSL